MSGSEERAAELERECAELRRRLEVVYASRSWRLTAPLRRIGELGRGLRGSPATTRASPSAPPPAEEPGYPPAALRERVAGTADLDWFKAGAAMALEDIDDALARAGAALERFERVYDFGCGCGRIALGLAERLGPERITATDPDGEATAWLAARLPRATVQRSPTLPPTRFPDGAFDLIVGWSIFTHLPEDHQDAWLAELARLLAPGGLMLQTVRGPASFDVVGAGEDDPVRNSLAERGFIFYEGNYGADSPFASHYQTTFHHPDYVRERWSRWFDVVEVGRGCARPELDMVVLAPRSAAPPRPGR